MRSPKTICKRNEQCQLYTSHLDSEKPIFRNEVCCQHYLFLRESKRQNTYIHIYVYIHIYIYVYIHAYICVCGYICISKIKSSLIRKTNCLPQMLTLLGVFSTKFHLLVFLQDGENMEGNDWLFYQTGHSTTWTLNFSK